MSETAGSDASNGAGIKKIEAPMEKTIQSRIKILFVDIPQLFCLNDTSKRPDFKELSASLWREWDYIFAFASFQKWEQSIQGPRLLPRVYQSLSHSGIYPILTPSDPDPIIAANIVSLSSKYGHHIMIGLLSGDSGFFNSLLEAKKFGSTIKLILPNGNRCTALKSIADEISKVSDYAKNFYTEELNASQSNDKAITEKSPIKETMPPVSNSLHITMGGA